MDKDIDIYSKDGLQKELDEWRSLIEGKLDNLGQAINKRFEALKKVIGDYLELSSSISLASVKTSLKSV